MVRLKMTSQRLTGTHVSRQWRWRSPTQGQHSDSGFYGLRLSMQRLSHSVVRARAAASTSLGKKSHLVAAPKYLDSTCGTFDKCCKDTAVIGISKIALQTPHACAMHGEQQTSHTQRLKFDVYRRQAYCHPGFGFFVFPICFVEAKPHCWFGQHLIHVRRTYAGKDASLQTLQNTAETPEEDARRAMEAFSNFIASQKGESIAAHPCTESSGPLANLDSPCLAPSTLCGDLPHPARVPDTFIKFSKVFQRL